jgi:hypothetical protein
MCLRKPARQLEISWFSEQDHPACFSTLSGDNYANQTVVVHGSTDVDRYGL